MATPKQTDPQFKLRLTLDLKLRIEAAAQANNRSMNAEIVATLEEKYPAPLRKPTALGELASELGIDVRNLSEDDVERLQIAIRDAARRARQVAEDEEQPEPG